MGNKKEIQYYEIDWARVRNIEDVKIILKSIIIAIPEDLEGFQSLIPYLTRKEETKNNNIKNKKNV